MPCMNVIDIPTGNVLSTLNHDLYGGKDRSLQVNLCLYSVILFVKG